LRLSNSLGHAATQRRIPSTKRILQELAARQCRICGHCVSATTTSHISNGYPLFSCGHCETVMIERRPRSEELNRAYDQLFEHGAYDAHRAEFQLLKSGKMPPNIYRGRLLKRLEALVQGRRLVEIGGGTGAFGVLAQSQGWRYTDYDISAAAIGFASELSLDARLFRLGEPPPLPAGSADVVVMWEVVEHVWNLHRYFTTIKNALKPGGVFLFSTPNYLRPVYRRALDQGKSLGSIPPVHINFFTTVSLRKALAAAGFTSFKVTKRRIYKPPATLHGALESLKVALCLVEPMTLIGIAKN
jgi:SAM-dependent methyltransferase